MGNLILYLLFLVEDGYSDKILVNQASHPSTLRQLMILLRDDSFWCYREAPSESKTFFFDSSTLYDYYSMFLFLQQSSANTLLVKSQKILTQSPTPGDCPCCPPFSSLSPLSASSCLRISLPCSWASSSASAVSQAKTKHHICQN